MRWRNYLLLFMMVIILSSCSQEEANEEGISEKYYDVFVNSYNLYEERVQESGGEFIDADGEIIDFPRESIFGDSDLFDVSLEDMKREEAGEETVLTEEEAELKEDFLSLYLLKHLRAYPSDMKHSIIQNNPGYADPFEAAIELEEKIINILQLDKESITARFLSESN